MVKLGSSIYKVLDGSWMLQDGVYYRYKEENSIFQIRDIGENVVYEGEMKRVHRAEGTLCASHGYGVENRNQQRYIGLWKNGMYHGFGVVLFHTYDRFCIEHIGFYQKGKRHGVGRVFFPDQGLRYVGHFRFGEYDGYGIQYTRSRKLKYEGFFKKGKYEGIGKEFYLHGKIYRFGFFKKGKAHGEIIEYLPNGFVYYNGSMKDNQYSGNGILWTTISKYQGQFRRNDFHGIGYFQSDDNYFYEGCFRKNRFHGNGILYIRDRQRLYHGEFCGGLVHGFAKYFHNNILVYKGMFKNGVYHGKGVYQNKTQEFFQGNALGNEKLSFQDESVIKQMIETNTLEKVKSITKKKLALYAEKYNFPFHKRDAKRKIMVKFCQHYQTMIQTNSIDPETDLFGNPIVVACLGNDHGIYDLHSMQEFFRTNDKNEYVHHPYHWTADNQYVPKFPVVHEGRVLSDYTILK